MDLLLGNSMKKQKGFSILEPLLAIGIMAIVFLTIASLMVMSNFETGKANEYQKASWLAQEGMEALRTISFGELVTTTVGSLNFVSSTGEWGRWVLEENGPQTIDLFTRYIAVSELTRNDNCEIDGAGEIMDTDSFKLQSKVEWQDNTGQTRDITLETVRTNWEEPTGLCFGDTDLGQLSFNFSGTTWYGGKQLRSIYITNIGTRDVNIAKMMMTWNYPELMQQMFMGNEKVWSGSGPGTPSGNQPSGTELDIVDKTITVGETIEMHKTQFTNIMEGSIISITVIMEDGSSTSTGDFMPAF
jgi:type II secretory pathway pseudopilin PulG